MYKCQMLFVTVVGLVVLSGGYAAADIIIDPITPTTTSGFSSQLVIGTGARLPTTPPSALTSGGP